MKNATEIVMVLDKSGSMDPLAEDVIGGFNNFIRENQELPQEAFVTVILFDSQRTMAIEGRPIHSIEPIGKHFYRPHGTTALLDAVGYAIDSTGTRLRNVPEEKRPNKVIFVIMTDGEENSSTKFKKDQIASMIKHQEEVYNWKFLYFGANVDAFAEASKINIPRGSTFSYNSNSRGIRHAYSIMSQSVQEYRSQGNQQAPVAGTIGNNSVSINDKEYRKEISAEWSSESEGDQDKKNT